MISTDKFHERVGMLTDPYFDREFFTDLIYCADRGKSIRDMFEAVVGQWACSPEPSQDLDKSLLQLFYAFQASSLVRESYQWLPIAQSFYAGALNRSNGQKPIGYAPFPASTPKAISLADFSDSIRRETRSVASPEATWEGLLFLLENRTSRAQAVGALLGYAVVNSDALSLQLLAKGVEAAMSCGWKSNAAILKRPFERFWSNPKPLQVVSQGFRISKALRASQIENNEGAWESSWADDIWQCLTQQSVESAWEKMDQMFQKGMTLEQGFHLLALLRGRAFFAMKSEQWTRVAASLLYGDALHTSARWCTELGLPILATSLVELAQLGQMIGAAVPLRPTGAQVLDGTSQSISKDRLILRLDDVVERGERHEALEIMAVILKDQGLSQTVCDRLVLMASKQDAWNYDQKTMAVAVILTKAFDSALQAGMSGQVVSDAIHGLLRFLSDQRDQSLTIVEKTGTYGDGLKASQFDVSGGARIVDRFVFNQMRNAQRVKIWPSDN